MYHYTPTGTCSTGIDIETRDGVITRIIITDGCDGNAQGMAALLTGFSVDEAIARLKGIQCQNGTSCPDQLARALESMKDDREV